MFSKSGSLIVNMPNTIKVQGFSHHFGFEHLSFLLVYKLRASISFYSITLMYVILFLFV
jgi:hypothetical protein